MNPRSERALAAIFIWWTHRLPKLAQCPEKPALLASGCVIAAMHEHTVLRRKHKVE